jgi:RNA polymerase sigma factor (sigma-70 family)
VLDSARARWSTSRPSGTGAEESIGADLLDLVVRCRGGDAAAWSAFLAPFETLGRRALRSFRLSAAETEDILSEALTSLYGGGLRQFRGGTMGELVAFLRTVVRNQAIDLLKTRSKWAPADAAEAGPPEAARPAGDPVSGGLADAQCLEFLRQEVDGLARADRELFLMKARGMKEREIAEQTGRPPGTVASQIARLLERLRARLRERGCL